ncbi:unnamed protein product [Arctogadus glacialis]
MVSRRVANDKFSLQVVSWRWCSETISTPTKGFSELDWSSVDLPHSSPQTQIWTNMILVMWMFGAVTLTITSHAASIPGPWQMFLKCLPWAFTKDLDLSCDWRPQTQFWVILVEEEHCLTAHYKGCAMKAKIRVWTEKG